MMAAGHQRNVNGRLCPRKRPYESISSKNRKRERVGGYLDPEVADRFELRKIGAGLANLGNTCFLNSVLQCLTYTEPLAAYFLSGRHKKICNASGFCALCAIQNHVMNALKSSGKILAPSHLVKNLRCISRNFRLSRQEDAHEYMVQLMESMHKCSLPSGIASESPHAYEKSLVHKIFGGRLRSRIRCPKCSFCSDTYEPFLDLSLQIMHSDSLVKALSEFTAVEQLEVYNCDHCKRKVGASKQLTVDKAPNILAIHLKRFNGLTGAKINKRVDFGRTLDLKPFMNCQKEQDINYTLYGVLVHAGHSTQSGHYFCFIRTSTGLWHALDDNQVYQVSEKYVFGQKAYMLFYVCNKRTPRLQCSQSGYPGSSALQDSGATPKGNVPCKESYPPSSSEAALLKRQFSSSNSSKDLAHVRDKVVEKRISFSSTDKWRTSNISSSTGRKPSDMGKMAKPSRKDVKICDSKGSENPPTDVLRYIRLEKTESADSNNSRILPVSDGARHSTEGLIIHPCESTKFCKNELSKEKKDAKLKYLENFEAIHQVSQNCGNPKVLLRSEKHITRDIHLTEKRLTLPIHYSNLSRFLPFRRHSVFRGILKTIQKRIRLKIEKHFRLVKKHSTESKALCSQDSRNKCSMMIRHTANPESDAKATTSTLEAYIVSEVSAIKSRKNMNGWKSIPHSVKFYKSSGYGKHCRDQRRLATSKFKQNHLQSSLFIQRGLTSPKEDCVQVSVCAAESSSDESSRSQVGASGSLNSSPNDIASRVFVVAKTQSCISKSAGCSLSNMEYRRHQVVQNSSSAEYHHYS